MGEKIWLESEVGKGIIFFSQLQRLIIKVIFQMLEKAKKEDSKASEKIILQRYPKG